MEISHWRDGAMDIGSIIRSYRSKTDKFCLLLLVVRVIATERGAGVLAVQVQQHLKSRTAQQ